MCRLAGWVGRPLPLSALTHAPPHSLLAQSSRPRLMRVATVNADGIGAAWYPDDGDPRPVRYRVSTPAWSDENLQSLAPRVRSRCLIASVRSATPGLPVAPASTAPFVHGRLALTHNGALTPFREAFMRAMREELSDEAYALIIGGTDSEHVFATIWQEMAGDESTESVEAAVRATIHECDALAREHGGQTILNLLVTNGEALVATRFATEGTGASLFIATGAAGYEGGTVIASEPLTEDPAWLPVDDRMLIVATTDDLRRTSLA